MHTMDMDDDQLRAWCEALTHDVPRLMSILRDRDGILRERNRVVAALQAVDAGRLAELVARLRALMADATPAGWVVERDEYEGFISHADGARFPTLFRPGVNNPRSREDAKLVVEAVNALPTLLAVVEACVDAEGRRP